MLRVVIWESKAMRIAPNHAFVRAQVWQCFIPSFPHCFERNDELDAAKRPAYHLCGHRTMQVSHSRNTRSMKAHMKAQKSAKNDSWQVTQSQRQSSGHTTLRLCAAAHHFQILGANATARAQAASGAFRRAGAWCGLSIETWSSLTCSCSK